MYEFRLPDIGEGLSEAELLQWTVHAGDRIEEGQEVAQISTDKVNVDLLAPISGVVTELVGSPGDVIPVGSVIMRIDDGSAAEHRPPVDHKKDEARAPPAPDNTMEKPRAPVRAAPAVRRYAARHGVAITAVSGTGVDGRITRDDIEAFIARSGKTEPTELDEYKTGMARQIRLSGPRRTAARNLEQGHSEQVTTSLSFEVMADALMREAESAAGPAPISPLAVVARRLVTVLRAHPLFNASIGTARDELELIVHEHVDLGIAVTTPEGLLVPVLRQAEEMDLAALATAIERLANLARDGTIDRADLAGSSFTLSSTGGLERARLTAATPVINFPNVATLWVSRIRACPRIVGDRVEAGPVIHCSLSFDHRFLHGADAIAFINALAAAFED